MKTHLEKLTWIYASAGFIKPAEAYIQYNGLSSFLKWSRIYSLIEAGEHFEPTLAGGVIG